MGNCCQPPLSSRLTDVDLTKPNEAMAAEKDPVRMIAHPAEKNQTASRITGSTRKILSDDNKPRDTQSMDMNHQLMRKEKKIGNLILIEKDVIHENIEKIERPVDAAIREFLNNAFKKHFALASLSEDEKYAIINKMFYCSVKKSEEYVFRQGDSASCFFVLFQGEVTVEIDSKMKRSLGPGEGFGELALLYNAPRSASIKAVSPDTFFWGIERKVFRDVVEESAKKNWAENRKFLERVALFSNLTDEQKEKIATVVLNQKFSAGQNIVEFGDQATSYYIIKEGTLDCLNEKGVVIRELGEGGSFGEQALYYNSTRQATVKAKTAVSVMVVARDSLKEILGKNMIDVVYGNSDRWALEKSKVFSKLSKINLEKLLQSGIERRNVQEGEVLQSRGKTISKIVICNEGDMEYTSTPVIALPKGSIFGDTFAYPMANQKLLLDGDLVMKKAGVVGEIKMDVLERLLNGTLEEAISKNERIQMKKETKVAPSAAKNEIITKMNLSNLIFLKKVGEGQFGSVFVVKDKTSGRIFALKAISISQVNDDGLEKHILCEKDVLLMIKGCHHLVDFQGYFRDNYYIYFLLDYIKGMELFDVIRVMDLLDNDQTRFYVGSMILALEQLHLRGVVYRDLKPENVMINEKGHLLLIDMGTAKVLNNSKKGLSRTYTILGTPHYMAPEILKGKGYDFAVDIWSLGICMYEFMCGLVPFGEECEDPYEVYQLISSQSLSYPNYFKDKKNKYARALIEQLLNRNPNSRTGGSFDALKANMWFGDFDWDKLAFMELEPPFVPPANKLISQQEIQKLENNKVSFKLYVQKANMKHTHFDYKNIPNIKNVFAFAE